MKDIALDLVVSVTVSKALRNHTGISQKTRETAAELLCECLEAK
jgi:DNA-binding LacI/PurR family transcriptional regulator